jgi:hypothetical protein
VPTARKPADRASAAFLLVSEWIQRSAISALLAELELAHERPALQAVDWLHLNEGLPDWIRPVVDDPDATVAGLSAQQIRLLHTTLRTERIIADFNSRARDGVTYVERFQASEGHLDKELAARIVALSPEIGLVEPQEPRHPAYDMTLVLGGGYRSPLLRARYAALLQTSGTGLGQVFFLGSPRLLITETNGSSNPPEREVTDAYAPGAADEFGLMLAAALAEFKVRARETTYLCGCADATELCPRWRFRDSGPYPDMPSAFTHERRTELIGDDGAAIGSVLSASTGRPPYRPDTSDTFALWSRCAEPGFGQRVLVVTSQVFVPFQTFEGLRRLYLPFGLDIDTVGFGAEWGDRPQTGEFFLQETLSAVRSARRLLVDAAEVLTGAE